MLAAYYRDKRAGRRAPRASRSSATRPRSSSRASPQARSSRSGCSWLPGRRARQRRHRARRCRRCRTRPGSTLIDALSDRRPRGPRRRARARRAARDRPRPADGGHLPAARAHERDRHARDRLRRRGALARRAASSGCVRKHAYRPALIPIITVIGLQIALLLGGRGAHRDDVRVEGPRASSSCEYLEPATSSPCRASSCCSRSSSRSPTSSSTSSRRSSTRG